VLFTVLGDGGEAGFGEATILTGYTSETIDTSWAAAKTLAEKIAGLEASAAETAARELWPHLPFTSSAAVSAVEMAEGHPLLDIHEPTAVPLLAILNATEDAELEAEIEARLAEGYATLKVKVGFERERDQIRVARIQEHLGGRALIRLDGNQGYDRHDALTFAHALDPEGIELFEQPCAAEDWEAAKAVAEFSAVPMMLDESIYGPEDIERAAETGAARFIKLKLMKMGGLDALAEGLRRIHELGLTPVLGNGVASDIGCWMEACVARDLIGNAGEMNGFLKPRSGIFETPLAVKNGSVVLEPGMPALKDHATLAALSRDWAQFGGAA
jgi:L-alanine-DL-glutamate epimerase-like enolase superfamily enzyme